MKIRPFVLLLVILSLMSRTQAVSVDWNLLHSSYYDLQSWGEESRWCVIGGNLNRGIYIEFWFFDHGFLDATALNSEPNNFSIWVRQMSYGEIVDSESMRGEGLTYFYHAEKGRSGIDSDYAVAPNSYLAICVEAGTPRDPFYAYGWVGLGWDEDGYPPGPTVLASAWDADGGPMIVGGGSALTPEPSAALLLLVGGALLELRRRHSSSSVCRKGVSSGPSCLRSHRPFDTRKGVW